MSLVIEINHISKKYKYGESQPYYTLRDTLAGIVKSPLGLFPKQYRRNTNLNKNEFWALRDVSLKVEQGDSIGIIGSNGAGKSTLLKVLSRITPPTLGEVILRGSVGSLLEVGTGFQQELTGRENIYLNGAILGMTRREIRKKFDEIVEFSGVEKFLDTPVKHYSSGMYIRLAFSIAANLESEILIVDEVLAVGDLEFQKKCLGKMDNVARKEGRTVLFVSHNMASIENLCSKCIFLDKGEIRASGNTSKVIKEYLTHVISRNANKINNLTNRKGNGKARFTFFRIEDNSGKRLEKIMSGQDFDLVFGFRRRQNAKLKNVAVSFAVSDNTGRSIILHRTNFKGQNFSKIPLRGEFRCHIEKFPLAKGNYNIGIYLDSDGEAIDDPGVIAQISVEPGNFFGTGHSGMAEHSPVLIDGKWSMRES